MSEIEIESDDEIDMELNEDTDSYEASDNQSSGNTYYLVREHEEVDGKALLAVYGVLIGGLAVLCAGASIIDVIKRRSLLKKRIKEIRSSLVECKKNSTFLPFINFRNIAKLANCDKDVYNALDSTNFLSDGLRIQNVLFSNNTSSSPSELNFTTDFINDLLSKFRNSNKSKEALINKEIRKIKKDKNLAKHYYNINVLIINYIENKSKVNKRRLISEVNKTQNYLMKTFSI